MFAAASVFAVLLSSTFAAATSCAAGRTYTVQAGDYCDSISAAHNSSTYQLSLANKDIINEKCSNIVVGQTLCLGLEGQDCQTTYVVASGDYCSLIATKVGVNMTMLLANNPQLDEKECLLYVGEVLCTANSIIAAPAPADFILPGTADMDNEGLEAQVLSSSIYSALPSSSESMTSTDSVVLSTSVPPTSSESSTTTSAPDAGPTEDADYEEEEYNCDE